MCGKNVKYILAVRILIWQKGKWGSCQFISAGGKNLFLLPIINYALCFLPTYFLKLLQNCSIFEVVLANISIQQNIYYCLADWQHHSCRFGVSFSKGSVQSQWNLSTYFRLSRYWLRIKIIREIWVYPSIFNKELIICMMLISVIILWMSNKPHLGKISHISSGIYERSSFQQFFFFFWHDW